MMAGRLVAGALSLFGSVLPAALMGIVLAVVAANVAARSLLGMSFHAAHDIALIAFAGLVWFGVVGAAVNGQMFGVNWFVDRLPPRLRMLARIVAHLLVIAIACAVIHAAQAQVATARFTRFLSLGWPKWIVSAGLGTAMVLLILVQISQIAALLRHGGRA